MKPLTIVYWSRAGLGLVIGMLCGLYVYFSVSTELRDIYTLVTGLSFAMLFYIATHYILKFKFSARVEKQSKLMTQGIGIYFFAWIVTWTLMVSLLLPTVSVRIVDKNTQDLLAGPEFWIAALDSENNVVKNLTTTSGTLKMSLLPPGDYTFKLGNTNQTQELTIGWLQSENVTFNVP